MTEKNKTIKNYMGCYDEFDWKSDYNNLKFMADCDFCSVIILYYSSFLIWPYHWLTMHSIEKYLKSIILKHDESYNPKKDWHEILKLWNKVKCNYNEFNMIDFNLFYELFNWYINEISTIISKFRYWWSSYSSMSSIINYVIFTNYLRYTLIWRENYSSNYWLTYLWNEYPSTDTKTNIIYTINTIMNENPFSIIDSNWKIITIIIPDYLKYQQ